MGKGKLFVTRIMDTSNLTVQSLPGLPIIEIAGDQRVLIENHCGVKEYGHERILVQVAFGCVCVSGCQLEMVRMTKEQLVIYGRIGCIQILRKERS